MGLTIVSCGSTAKSSLVFVSLLIGKRVFRLIKIITVLDDPFGSNLTLKKTEASENGKNDLVIRKFRSYIFSCMSICDWICKNPPVTHKN